MTSRGHRVWSWRTFALAGVALLVCAVMLLPILWAVSTSLKPNGEILAFPPRWLPEKPTLAHYAAVLRSSMPTYFLNSVLITLGTTIVTIGVALHVAYAVTRFRFRLRRPFLLLLLCAMMMPGVANLVPIFLLANEVGLLDTYTLLIIVYSVWLLPTAVWILADYFRSIPDSLDKAALVDGYSRWYAFYRICVPLSRPGQAAAAIMIFVFVWNEFIIALTLLSSDDKRPVQVGLHYYLTVLGIEWGEFTAAVVLTLLPVIVLFILFQRSFVSGMTSGAMKG
jgi:ABC-type glycerol-3-phosphate transport system permease component